MAQRENTQMQGNYGPGGRSQQRAPALVACQAPDCQNVAEPERNYCVQHACPCVLRYYPCLFMNIQAAREKVQEEFRSKLLMELSDLDAQLKIAMESVRGDTAAVIKTNKKTKADLQEKNEIARKVALQKAEQTVRQQVEHAQRTQKEVVPHPSFVPCGKACPNYREGQLSCNFIMCPAAKSPEDTQCEAADNWTGHTCPRHHLGDPCRNPIVHGSSVCRDHLDEFLSPVTHVRLDGLALLKIVQHCTEHGAEVSGHLTGLNTFGTLEVTNALPLPNSSEKDSMLEQMLQFLKRRDFEYDYNVVGWYRSSLMISFLQTDFLEALYDFQRSIPSSVVLVYDRLTASDGQLGLKAYRLTQKYMKLHAEKKLAHHNFRDNGVFSTDILEEVPIMVHNSPLVHSFLFELRDNKQISSAADRLALAPSTFAEKNFTELSQCVEEYRVEQGNLQFWQREMQRHKLEADKMANEGKSPLAPFDKPAPSRLKTFLLLNHMSAQSADLEQNTSQELNKLKILDALMSSQPAKDASADSAAAATN